MSVKQAQQFLQPPSLRQHSPRLLPKPLTAHLQALHPPADLDIDQPNSILLANSDHLLEQHGGTPACLPALVSQGLGLEIVEDVPGGVFGQGFLVEVGAEEGQEVRGGGVGGLFGVGVELLLGQGVYCAGAFWGGF
jgi:hypothetical protein